MANFVREQSELQNIHIHSLFLHSHPVHSRINDGVPNCTALGKDLLMQITIHFSYYKMNFKCTRQYPFSLRVSHKQQNELQMNNDVLFLFFTECTAIDSQKQTINERAAKRQMSMMVSNSMVTMSFCGRRCTALWSPCLVGFRGH